MATAWAEETRFAWICECCGVQRSVTPEFADNAPPRWQERSLKRHHAEECPERATEDDSEEVRDLKRRLAKACLSTVELQQGFNESCQEVRTAKASQHTAEEAQHAAEKALHDYRAAAVRARLRRAEAAEVAERAAWAEQDRMRRLREPPPIRMRPAPEKPVWVPLRALPSPPPDAEHAPCWQSDGHIVCAVCSADWPCSSAGKAK